MIKGFLCGLAASLIAGLVMLVFRITSNTLTVPELLIDWVTTVMPLHLFSTMIDTFGHWAKPLLVASLTVAMVLAGGVVGMVWHRLQLRWPSLSHRLKWLAAGMFSLVIWLLYIAFVFRLSRRGYFGTALSPWPLGTALVWLASSFGYAFCLVGLYSWWPKARAPGIEEVAYPERRLMLKRLGWTAAGVAVAAGVGVGIWKLVSSLGGAVISSFSRSKLSPEVTPNGNFYAVSKDFVDPSVEAASWKLKVTGLVERELVINYQQLKEMPAVTQYLTLECISNEVGGNLISNALWKGVRLRDILSQAGAKSSARKVVLSGADVYTDSIALNKAMDDGTILAYEMNGVPLPRAHGFPVRLLVPGIYGMKNVKWLNEIELVDYDYHGYWEEEGWSNEATIQTMSRIDVPGQSGDYRLADLEPAGGLLGGVAFAGDRGISWVEVSTDGGKTWNRAQVKESLSPYTWVLWVYNWIPPGPGDYVLKVRAADGQGTPQVPLDSFPLPDGATGYHTISISLVRESTQTQK